MHNFIFLFAAIFSSSLTFSQEIPFDYNGIVSIRGCSGAIVRFEGQPEDDQAYMLTNGHCVKLYAANEVEENKVTNRAATVFKNKEETRRVTLTKLVYGTMTKTDLAIYQVDQTYADLMDNGIEAFTLASVAPLVGTPVDIISGYHKREFRCDVEKIVDTLLEHVWTWRDSIRFTTGTCATFPGTSGSPIISRGKREVIAVNNTMNADGQECTLNNPCEVDIDGSVSIIRNRAYAQQTYWLYSCLTEDFKIDTSKENCQLAK